MKLKDSELKSILAEVESEMASLLKSEASALSKAAGENEEEQEESAPSEMSAPAADASPAPTEGSEPATEASGEASGPAPEVSASADLNPEASAEGSAPADPAAEAGPVDPEALKAEYSKLDPEALKAHYIACKTALFELMSAGAGGPPGAEASAGGPPPEMSAPAPAGPPAGAPPPGPEMAPPPPKPLAQSEMKEIPANGNALKESKSTFSSIEKSEASAKIADLEAQVELLTKAVDLSLRTPMRKAVTSVAHIAKSEDAVEAKPLSKSDIQNKISTVIGSGKLSKSQKDRLFSFSLGNAQFDDIKDILEVK